MPGYRGRFAPSPTGPLHAGSLVAALASWLDARAHQGRWLVRIEDLDPPREQRGAAERILSALNACGLASDEPVVRQSERHAGYATALARLGAAGLVYPCGCSRREVEGIAAARGLAAGVYPGSCRPATALPVTVPERLAAAPAAAMPPGPRLRAGPPAGPVVGHGCAWRLRVPEGARPAFHDRALGPQVQDLGRAVGDFVLLRADGLWAYQLAVVVDDADQEVSDVVRGSDLLDNTPRQVLLQQLLGLPTPRYLHVPVVVDADGRKLSKQTGAPALDPSRPLAALAQAGHHLGLDPVGGHTVAEWLERAVAAWRDRWIGRLPTMRAARAEAERGTDG